MVCLQEQYLESEFGSENETRINSQEHTLEANRTNIIRRYGYFLDADLGQLDTSFFTMPKMELERADPQQRQLLEVTRECFESAGEVDYRGKNIGCFVGSFGEGVWTQLDRILQLLTVSRLGGNVCKRTTTARLVSNHRIWRSYPL